MAGPSTLCAWEQLATELYKPPVTAVDMGH